jgi:hypothetical protein
MSKPAVLAIRAISMERESRTVIEATTSPRASLSFTGLRKMSLAAIGSPLKAVIAGLVPAISLRLAPCSPKRDGRDKPGHDGVEGW